MKSKITNYATIIMGLLLLAVSLYLIKTSNDPQGVMRTLPYVCIGVGCGLFGHGMGNVISERAINSAPELKKKLDIEKNDERNVAIANKAKGKAFDVMTWVFSALMVSFALMGIDTVAVLLLVFAYLLVHGFDEPKQWEIREVNDIMNHCVTGWHYFSNPRMFPEYGRQKGWEREAPATDTSNGAEKIPEGFVEVTEQMELPF